MPVRSRCGEHQAGVAAQVARVFNLRMGCQVLRRCAQCGLNGSQWKTVNGFFPIKADYVSMHENLLDQTHFPFLHPGAIGTPEYARSKLDARMDGDSVVIDRALLNSPPPGVYAMPTGLVGKPVDRFSEARIVDNNDPSGKSHTY
jgi:hypothetical protein